MSDWIWIPIVAFVLLIIWNLNLQSTNNYLRRELAFQAQEIRELRQQINSRSYQSTSDGCLGTLLWIIAIAAVAWVVLSALA